MTDCQLQLPTTLLLHGVWVPKTRGGGQRRRERGREGTRGYFTYIHTYSMIHIIFLSTDMHSKALLLK